jgi:hypothetical protein
MDDWELGTDKEVRKAKLYSGDDDLWCVLIEGDDEPSWVECPIYYHRESAEANPIGDRYAVES